jgi:hypothetical protein
MNLATWVASVMSGLEVEILVMPATATPQIRHPTSLLWTPLRLRRSVASILRQLLRAHPLGLALDKHMPLM